MDTSIRKHIDSLELYQIKNFKHNTAVFLKHSKAVKNAGLTQYYKGFHDTGMWYDGQAKAYQTVLDDIERESK
jgi:hypothetical protein